MQQNAVQLDIVINVVGFLLARDAVKRRLRDVNEALLHKLRHLAVEKGQQQGADVRTIHIGVRHDDDFVVAQFFDVKRAFTLAIADAGADGGDHRADFIVLQHFVQPRFLDVDQFAANRKDRLEFTVAALLGGATGGITFDDIKLGVGRITIGAVRQLARQTAAGHRRFANRFPRLARSLTGAGGGQTFVHNALGHWRIRIKISHQPLVSHRAGDTFHFGRKQFHLGLRFKLGIAVLHGNHRGQAFAHVVAGDLRILFLQEFVGLRVLVDRAGHRAAETGEMRAAVRIVNRVGVTKHLVVVAVVILHHDLDVDFDLLVVEFLFHFLAEGDWLGM